MPRMARRTSSAVFTSSVMLTSTLRFIDEFAAASPLEVEGDGNEDLVEHLISPGSEASTHLARGSTHVLLGAMSPGEAVSDLAKMHLGCPPIQASIIPRLGAVCQHFVLQYFWNVASRGTALQPTQGPRTC